MLEYIQSIFVHTKKCISSVKTKKLLELDCTSVEVTDSVFEAY